jgi:predicted transcriptional regulator of viral defense system
MAISPSSSRVLRLARNRRAVRRKELTAAGVHSQVLSRLVKAGALERVARGHYRLPDAPTTEHHGLALAAASVPRGVICLLSALSFHGIGTQLPHEVWIALDRRDRRPSLRFPRLRVLRFGGEALTEGIETHRIEGETVRIYCPAKSVADAFKYRNKIGLEIALEALREGWRARRFSMAELQRYATVCRVSRVMQPYLEALLA